MKNDERAPAWVLTDAEREQWALAEALDDLISDRGVTLDDDRLDWLAEFVAARTADADARLAAYVAAVEAVHKIDYATASDETWQQNATCYECRQSWPCDTIAALSATAPDAGQCEAQERAEVRTEWGVRWHNPKGTSIPTGTVRTRDAGDQTYRSEDDARRDCPPGAHVVSRQRTTVRDVVTAWTRADRSPEQP